VEIGLDDAMGWVKWVIVGLLCDTEDGKGIASGTGNYDRSSKF